MTTTREEFLEYLHNALNYLYNADQLRRSPLAKLFGVADRFDTSSALRKILVDAIDGLKPGASEPDQSKAWRTYDSLYCCFIQQLNQQVVADQLCISPRQLRREQRNALEYLADRLWERYGIGDPQAPPAVSGGAQSPQDGMPQPVVANTAANTAAPQPAEPAEGVLDELRWLIDTQPGSVNPLADEVAAALAVVQPLAEKRAISVQSLTEAYLPRLAVHPAALNQILVSLLGVAIEAALAQVRISARTLPAAVELTVAVDGGGAATSPESADSVQIAAELARLSGGKLLLPESSQEGTRCDFPIRLVLPALEQFPVLVVDDNEDSLQLYKRYAAGTRYALVCSRDTEPVMALVESIRPRIIVLDIMMPKENGWIVLGRLRQHPLTSQTPVIICTILPQEGLALSLGASAFLKKPVSREAFLQALDRQFDLLGPEFS